MDVREFDHYRNKFEQRIVLDGIQFGQLGKMEHVVRRYTYRLATSPFAKKMGTRLVTGIPCALDYYGLYKKSDGYWKLISELNEQLSGKQVKSVEAIVVHFNSIRIEKVAQLAPDLVTQFPLFKKDVLDARGFRHKYGV